MGRDGKELMVLGPARAAEVPRLVRMAGVKATRRYYEFFTANIRNRNTRQAYHRALVDFFAWCDDRRLALDDLEPIVIAAYVEHLAISDFRIAPEGPTGQILQFANGRDLGASSGTAEHHLWDTSVAMVGVQLPDAAAAGEHTQLRRCKKKWRAWRMGPIW